jgi:formate hydrogenlyase subunit 4
MKFFVLLCIFLNVLVTPWGLAGSQQVGMLLLAIPLLLLKIFVFLLVLVLIESSLAKLRLFRITEFLTAAFITSVAAVLTRLLQI